jgi:hypothetical protein
MEFRLYEEPAVYAGMLLWPAEAAREVLAAWVEWTRTVPDEVTTSARILHVPPLPELPEVVRGRSIVRDRRRGGRRRGGPAAVLARSAGSRRRSTRSPTSRRSP